MHTFPLPGVITNLVKARDVLRGHYLDVLRKTGSTENLRFTLDGNLIGDIGEALAVELFGVSLVSRKSTEGIDGFAPDGRSVQVKATGTARGPAFRNTSQRAQHLLFFDLDIENGEGQIVFNGPEQIAFEMLRNKRTGEIDFSGQRSLTRKQIEQANELVSDELRLKRV